VEIDGQRGVQLAEPSAVRRRFGGEPSAGDAFANRRRLEDLFEETEERGAVDEMGRADQMQAADELHQGLGGGAFDLEEPFNVYPAPALAARGCDASEDLGRARGPGVGLGHGVLPSIRMEWLP
jgi:hypothetical protein